MDRGKWVSARRGAKRDNAVILRSKRITSPMMLKRVHNLGHGAS